MNLFSSGMSVGATQNYTTSATCKSFELSNMSHYDIQVQSATLLPYTLPAFATKSFLANPSEEFNFTLQNDPLNPAIQNGEYIQLSESSIAITSSVTPLALIPVYTTDVNISGGNVNISNATLTVTGGVDVNNNPQVTVSNTSIPVTNESGGSLTVAGTLDANITGSSVTIDTSNVDAFVANNSLVYFGSQTTDVTNLAAGAQIKFPDIINTAAGYFEGVYCILSSSNGYSDYNFIPNNSGVLFKGIKGVISTAYLFNLSVTTSYTNTQYTGSAGAGYNTWTFSTPTMFSDIAGYLVNTSSNTIASDAVTVTVYAIMTSVTASIGNQPATGAYESFVYFSESISSGGPTTFTVLAANSNQYIKSITLTQYGLTANSSGNNTGQILITNGSTDQVFALTNFNAPLDTDPLPVNPTTIYGNGIANNGITLSLNTGNGGVGSTYANGFIIVSTPNT